MPTTAVVLPGMDGTGRLLADFTAALSPDVEAHVVSYPGNEELNYADLEAFVRDRLPSGRPYFLLAESFSGPIAVSIAASPPAGLRGLVLCCSFVRNPYPVLRWAHLIARAFPLRLASSFSSRWVLGKHSSARLRGLLASALNQVSPSALQARLRAVLSIDVRAELAQVRVPVLYLRATEDRLVPASAGAEVKRILPAAGVTDLEGPHFLLQAMPVVAAREVKAFMKQIEP